MTIPAFELPEDAVDWQDNKRGTGNKLFQCVKHGLPTMNSCDTRDKGSEVFEDCSFPHEIFVTVNSLGNQGHFASKLFDRLQQCCRKYHDKSVDSKLIPPC